MAVQPFKYKNTDKTYSIGISERIPEDSINLAYAVSPKISMNNVLIGTEQAFLSDGSNTKESSLYYPDENNLLKPKTGSYVIYNNNVMVTDEFSVKRNSQEQTKPLYYYYQLQFKIDANDDRGIIDYCIPYVYGNEARTFAELEMAIDKEDNWEQEVSPSIDILNIKNSKNENVSHLDYKVKMELDSEEGDNIYKITVYHSFPEEQTFSVSYIDSNGDNRTEIIKSNIIFSKVNTKADLNNADIADKVYYINEEKVGYSVYLKSDIIKIDDKVRKPFEFKYKVVSNIKARFNKANPSKTRLGIVYLSDLYLDEDQSDNQHKDIESLGPSLAQEIGQLFPEYINLYNPHPPSEFTSTIEELVDKTLYFSNPDYWKVSLTAPQDMINNYDLIIITGYGQHNLTAYGDKIKEFLSQGGSVFVDNLSNTNSKLLNINFGDSSLLSYTYSYELDGDTKVLLEGKEFILTNNDYYNRYYDMASAVTRDICYKEETVNVAPEVSQINSEFVSIIRYAGGKPSIGYLPYKVNNVQRGKMYFSNAGILKGFLDNTSTSVKKFMTNLFLTIFEDLWVNTPWIYDRVYHIDQLYDDERTQMGYEINIDSNRNLVANKIITNNIRSLVSKYSNYELYNFVGKHYIDCKEYYHNNTLNRKDWFVSRDVGHTDSMNDSDKLCVYAKKPGPNYFDVDNLDGYSKNSIKIYNDSVEFKYVIRPYTFLWDDGMDEVFSNNVTKEFTLSHPFIDSTVQVKRLLPNNSEVTIPNSPTGFQIIKTSNKVKIFSTLNSSDRIRITYTTTQVNQEKIYSEVIKEGTFSISRNNGVQTVGLLSTLVPPLPDGMLWFDRKNVYYEIEVAKIANGSLIKDEKRINLFIYDKQTGDYMFNANGESSISHDDLYRVQSWLVNNRQVTRKKSEDYLLQASTDYYSMAINRRTASIQVNDDKEIDIQLPQNLNTNEAWFPRIKNIDCVKTSFNKDDFERWESMFGFKFEKSYIETKLLDAFGDDPEDDIISSIIAKLGNDEKLTKEDIQVISQFFDVINDNVKYEYSIVDYEKQPWNPTMPIKKQERELAKYVDKHVIQLNFKNIHVDTDIVDGKISDELADKISTLTWRLNNTNLVADKGFTIKYYYNGVLTDVPSEKYSVDFPKGIIVFNDESWVTTYIVGFGSGNLYADYYYSTIRIFRKKYINQNVRYENLDRISDNWYDSKHTNIIGASDVDQDSKNGTTLNPLVYKKNKYESTYVLLDKKDYEIDYERGMVKVRQNLPEYFDIFMTYSYFTLEELDVQDYDEKAGRITLKQPITFRDNIFVSYYYEDKYVDYKGYLHEDVNGKKTFVRLDINPTYGHLCTVTRETDGQLGWKNIPTHQLLGQNVYFYMMPRAAYRGDKELYKNDSTLRHTFDFEELKLLQLQHPEIIYIGYLKLTDDYTRYDVEILDARVNGGGLKESISKQKIESKDELAMNLWDISNLKGRSFVGNGIVVVKIPKRVLAVFSEKEVESIVGKYLALGVLPIIKYY